MEYITYYNILLALFIASTVFLLFAVRNLSTKVMALKFVIKNSKDYYIQEYKNEDGKYAIKGRDSGKFLTLEEIFERENLLLKMERYGINQKLLKEKETSFAYKAEMWNEDNKL